MTGQMRNVANLLCWGIESQFKVFEFVLVWNHTGTSFCIKECHVHKQLFIRQTRTNLPKFILLGI